MRILVSAVSAKVGGAVTYLLNVSAELARRDSGAELIFVVPLSAAAAIQSLNPRWLVIATDVAHKSWWKRLWFDQVTLRRLLKSQSVDVLYSTANFGMFACPCPQLLLVRNILQFSPDYENRVLVNQRWRLRIDHALRRWLICRSIASADLVMIPSQAMLDAVRRRCRLADTKTLVNPYGVNPKLILPETSSRPARSSAEFRLFFSALYGEHKNFATLLRALGELRKNGVNCRLFTTADPRWEGARWTTTRKADAELAGSPELKSHIEFAAIREADAMLDLYAGADLFVYPSTIESFGHPLIEAMAAGLPIVIADAAINRELCGDAAIYFSEFNFVDCARKITRLARDPELRRQMANRAAIRSRQFRWDRHVQLLMEAFQRLSHPTAAARQ